MIDNIKTFGIFLFKVWLAGVILKALISALGTNGAILNDPIGYLKGSSTTSGS